MCARSRRRRGTHHRARDRHLLEGGWRERRTAAWLVAVSEFRERLGRTRVIVKTCGSCVLGSGDE
ncbi:DUF6000 family protein [Streptomyces sp. NPDC001212]|uniref:DUF6000 family protein n=1 Tax=Streptomyces sp. CoT10 TaxID=2875762 RepID=UPI0035A97CAC